MTASDVYLIGPTSDLSEETSIRRGCWNTRKKKTALAGFGSIIFISLVIFLIFESQKGEPTLIRRDFEPLYNLTISAMYETMDVYCTQVPLLFTDDCDKFINRFLKRMTSKPPQLILPPESNFNDKKVSNNALLINMADLMRKYIFIFDQLMEQEHYILCNSSVVNGMKCIFPKSCANQQNESNAMLYCGLHSIQYYLTEVKKFSEKGIPDAIPSHPLTDEVPYFSQGAPSGFRRWYIMATIKVAINQVTVFRNLLEMTQK